MSTTIACIQGAHAIAAHFAGPHWLINDEDAKNYATAINNVARHYDIAVAQKTIDICNLVGMVAFIEGTRVLYSRRPPPPPRQPGAQVFQFSPPAPDATPAANGPPQTGAAHPMAPAPEPEAVH